ncbi:vacuolar fusion protein CCZ1-like [Silurus meridionalis]|nr:vacuolar fusion protein CCZ1-like [Silurus meridionalis]
MVVRNPMIEKPNKDGKPPTIEYQEDEILLFNGTFIRTFEAGGVELLIQKLEKFFYRRRTSAIWIPLHVWSFDIGPPGVFKGSGMEKLMLDL